MSDKIIAIDYDGTIAIGTYPEAGEPNWPVINKAKAEQAAGARLILWTCRHGAALHTALDACTSWGLAFDSVNENPPDRVALWGADQRKIFAHEYWDDRAVEIRYGEWKKSWHNSLIGHEYEECSICGCMISDTEKFWDCNFCPNCGAKMHSRKE